jgi:hypothetical protein
MRCMIFIQSHGLFAFRSTALAVEQEAHIREGVVGETVGFPTTRREY